MNIFRATKVENVEFENQAKFVQERILSTEEKLAALCSAFGTYTQKNSRLRDAGDEISSTVYKLAMDETISRTLKINLAKFAEFLAIIGDLRESEIIHIEENVLKQFLKYNTLCRNAKSEIRNIFNAKEHEISRRRHLGKLQLKDPHNRRVITKAETELSKAAAESSQVQRELEEHIEIFERKKLVDLKTVLMEFVTAELRLHAEALEVFTEAYKSLNNINIEDDFQAFKKILKQSPLGSRLEIVMKTSDEINNISTPSHQLSSTTSENGSASRTSSDKAEPRTECNGSSSYEEYSSTESSSNSETNTEIEVNSSLRNNSLKNA